MAKIKYILTVIIILCTITTYAQPAQYTPMTAAGYQMKRLKVDSTLHLPSFCGVPTLRGSLAKEGALAIDTCGALLYMWTRSGGWDTINVSGGGGGATDTTSLSNRINSKLSISDTASMLSPYLRAIDTSNKWVNSITRTPGKDSIIYFIGGNRFAIKDSVGSGGGSSGTVTSVGLTMPSAFNVASSPITTSGTIAVTGAGTVSQYVRGDGTLANFPTSTGGGSSINYYFNGSVSQGTIGGVAFREMSKTAILNTGTDFTINADGYIQSFITNAGDPGLLNIPGGNWNFEIYFSASSGGGSPRFYLELYKWDGATLALIATNSATPENITGGTAIDLYTTALAVPSTILSATDRLAIRVYVIHSGRTITLHTENGHLCQIITTFTTGLTALNGLTEQVQNFATGTSGTDFGISSASATHTFNLPTASATNRGALSTSDWSTFNGKLGASDTVSLSNRINGKLTIADTSALQRKSISAYSILANPTSTTANATVQAFKDTSGTYTGTITWTGTTAPSGATNHSYRLTQVGKCVTLNIALIYASNGAGLTSVQITLPSGAPTPAQPTGLTSAINNLYPMSVQISTTTNVMANVISRNALRNNISANGFELFSTFGSTGIAQCIVTVQYWTN
jgi:hypothetical protein